MCIISPYNYWIILIYHSSIYIIKGGEKMTLGYPDEILPYPAVEYIPLSIRTKNFTDNWVNRYKNKLFRFS